MPVAYGKLYVKDKNGGIVQIVPDATTSLQQYQGATSQSNGVSGIVPAPTMAEKNNFLKGDGTWGRVNKEVVLMSEEPTSQNTENLDDNSIIFQQISQSNNAPVIHSTGTETIHGTKYFDEGPYSHSSSIASDGKIDLQNGTYFKLTLSSNASLTIVHSLDSAAAASFRLLVANAGDYAITWPSSIQWNNSQTPAVEQNASTIFEFMTFDGGTSWYGRKILTTASE